MKKKSASQSAFFKVRILLGVLLCFAAITLVLFALGKASAQRTPSGYSQPIVQEQYRSVMQVFPRPNPYSDVWLAANHGLYDNIWTAEYETRLQQAGGPVLSALLNVLTPNYGPDVRMSNGNVLGSNQNEFQIDVNPTNRLNAIGTSNDGQTAGVGIFRTTDGGMTWTSADASAYAVPAACCDPGVAYGSDGSVYAIILDTSPTVTYIIKSTDGGATWRAPTSVSTPDRPNVAVDPTNSNIVYITFTDFNQPAGRIAGYKSTDGGMTWGSEFLIGDPISAPGYQQSSQPRVASNGWIYVGYQEYNDQNVGCAAGVRNEVARSTDGGATWTVTAELNIVQGGACSSAQAGRGIFCINGSQSFRSRSHPIMGISPTNPSHVYMVYSGGDLEPTGTYSCGGSTGNHSDTLFRRSTDGGTTWTAPVKINTDPDGANKDQYYPWMSVLPNGQIWVGWNDRRDDPNDFLSKWYQAHSNDEGATWLNINGAPGNDVVADVQTQPSTFIGDYHGLGASGNGTGNVLGMWFDSRNSASGDAYTDPQVPPPPGPTPTASPSPTATATASPTPTATPTATPCVGQYIIAQIGGSIVPGTVDVGNHCDDCTTIIPLPFPYTLYDQTFTAINVDSNGADQFVSNTSIFTNICLPEPSFSYAIMGYWDDLYNVNTGFGIFTSISGTAPNRIFNIEHRSQYFPGSGTANYEVRLYEGQTRFDVIYGTVTNGNTSATAGVQKDNTTFTQYFCNGAGGAATGGQSYTLQPCGSPSATPTATATSTATAAATATATATFTPTATPTATATATNTPTPTATPTPTPTPTPRATPTPRPRVTPRPRP